MENHRLIYLALILLIILTALQFYKKPQSEFNRILNEVEFLTGNGFLKKALKCLKKEPLTFKNPILLEITMDMCVRLLDYENYKIIIKRSLPLIKGDKKLLKTYHEGIIYFAHRFNQANQLARNKDLLAVFGKDLPENSYLSLLCLYQMKVLHFDKALKILDKLETNARFARSINAIADVYYRKAYCFFQTLQMKKSRYFAELAYKANPMNKEIVRFYANNTTPFQAIKVLEKFLQKKEEPSIYSALVNILVQEKYLDRAIMVLAKAAKKFPGVPFFKVRKAQLLGLRKRNRKDSEKLELKISIKNFPSPLKKLFLQGNWTESGQLDDVTILPPISMNKENHYSINTRLKKPVEGNFHFAIYDDKNLSGFCYQQEIQWQSKPLTLELDYKLFSKKVIEQRNFSLNNNPGKKNSRLFIFILDALAWNMIKPLMQQGDMPFLFSLHKKGASAILFAPYTRTNIALKILTTDFREQFYLSDYIFSMLVEMRQTNLWPKNKYLNALYWSYQKNSRQYPISKILEMQSIPCLDLVYHNYNFPSKDVNPEEKSKKIERVEQRHRLLLNKILDELKYRFDYFASRLEKGVCELNYFYENETDYLQHNLWARHKRSFQPINDRTVGWNNLTEAFQLLDGKMKEICLKYINPADTLIIISDHGMLNNYQHGQQGIFLAVGPGLKPLSELRIINQYDFIPMLKNYFASEDRRWNLIFDKNLHASYKSDNSVKKTGVH
ncbi:hypothetical protein ACFL35_03445 [Candidatus Riflebacteria bacterium]